MDLQNRHALLIAGNEYKFLTEKDRINEYLVSEAKLDSAKVTTLLGAYTPKEVILDNIRNFLILAESNPAIVVYNGHGENGAMYPNGDSLGYDLLADAFSEHKGDYIFINISCHSGSMIDVFKEKGLLPKKGLVLASANPDELCYESRYTDRLLDTFRRSRKFLKKDNGWYGTEITCVIDDLSPFEEKEIIIYGPNGKPAKTIVQLKMNAANQQTGDIIKKGFISDGTHPMRCGKSLDYLLFAR